jgi:acetyl esterase/lipase
MMMRAVRVVAWLLVVGATAMAWPPANRDPVGKLSQSGLASWFDVTYGRYGNGELKLDVFIPLQPPHPPSTPPLLRPAVLAIHGGSWIGGSKFGYRFAPQDTMVRLARAGMVVVAVDYPLARLGAPSYPTVVEGLRDAVRWIRAHAGELDVDPDRIAAFGQSSGAHLAALLAVRDAVGDAAAGYSSTVQAVIGFYGAYDLAALDSERHLTHDPVHTLVGGSGSVGDDALKTASPIARVAAGYPPTLLVHGTDDAWVAPEQSSRMAGALAGAGVVHKLILVPGARHGFEAMVNAPLPRDLLPEIFAFLEGVWNTPLPPR